MYGYLSADTICSKMWTVLRERSLRKTVSFKEQIMSKDKYTSMFSRKIEAVVLIILQYLQRTWNSVYEQLTVCCKIYFVLCILWYDVMNIQIFPLRRYNPQNVLSSSIKFLMKTYRSGCKVWKLGNITWVISSTRPPWNKFISLPSLSLPFKLWQP